MPDVFTKAKRSEVMSRIRSRGNQDTELRLRAVFRAQGITGWRRQVAVRYSGSGKPPVRKSVRPDFIFRAQKVAIFVDGCFWHGCPQHFRRPQTRQKFWDAKIARNQARDAEAAGADHVGGADLAAKVEEGWTDFDVVISTPAMMPHVGKLGKVLGPQGKMPNPKVGTVTDDVEKAVGEAKAGKVEYRTDRQSIVHLAIGKASA